MEKSYTYEALNREIFENANRLASLSKSISRFSEESSTWLQIGILLKQNTPESITKANCLFLTLRRSVSEIFPNLTTIEGLNFACSKLRSTIKLAESIKKCYCPKEPLTMIHKIGTPNTSLYLL